MRVLITSACVALISTVPANAQTYGAKNRLEVVPISATVFEVIESQGAGGQQIWCAAAEFNERVLGNTSKSQLIVKEKRGPSKRVQGRKSVVFTNDPAQVSVPLSKSVSVSVNTVGLTLPSHHARAFCHQNFNRARR